MGRLLFIWIFLILVPFSLAREGEVNLFELEEFSYNLPVQAIMLEKGEGVTFNLLGHSHMVFPSEIYADRGNIKLKVFVNTDLDSIPGISLPLRGDNSLLLDVNKDKTDDLRIRINKLEEKKVILLFESLGHAPNTFQGAGGEEKSTSQEEVTTAAVVEPEVSLSYTPYVVIGAIILALLGLMYLRKDKPSQPDLGAANPMQDTPSDRASSVDVKVEEIPFEEQK